MQPKTPVDYTGTGVAVTLASILGVTKCKWFQCVGMSIASVPARVGDSGVSLDVLSPVSVGEGFAIFAGGSQFSPPIAMMSDFYDLTKWYIIAAPGDIVEVGCAH